MTHSAWAARIGLAVVSMLVTGGGIEVALWALGNKPDYPDRYEELREKYALSEGFVCDETLGCRFVAEKMDDLRRGGNFRGKLNQLGFPDADEFELSEAQAESLKLLFIGDSFTFGAAAGFGKGYADLTEQALQAIRPTTVWNSGIPATGQRAQLATLRGLAPRMHPDLVVLGLYVGNDFDDNLYPLDWRPLGLDAGYIPQYAIGEDGEPIRMSPVAQAGLPEPAQLGAIEGALRRTRAGSLVWRALGLTPVYTVDVTPEDIDPRTWPKQIAETETLLAEIEAEVLRNKAHLIVVLIPETADVVRGRGARYDEAIRILGDLEIDTLEVLGAPAERITKQQPANHIGTKPDIRRSPGCL